MTGRARRLSAVASVAAGIGLVVMLASWMGARRDAWQVLRQEAHSEAVDAARRLGLAAGRVAAANRRLAKAVAERRLDEEELARRVVAVLDESPELFGAGVAYLPSGGEESRLAVYYGRRDHHVERIEIHYDYTGPGADSAWFRDALDDGAGWREPHFAVASKTWLASYTAPLLIPSGGSEPTVAGVVNTAVSIREYRGLLDALDLGSVGYGFLVSRGGALIAHPRDAWIGRPLPALDRSAAKNAESGAARDRPLDFRDPLSGQPAWLIYEPVPDCSWTLGVVFLRSELRLDNPEVRRRRLASILAAVVFLVTSTTWWTLYRRRLATRRLWHQAIVVSLVFLAGAASLVRWGFLAEPLDGDAVRLTGPAVVDRYLEKGQREPATAEPPIYVPTGLFLLSVSPEAHRVAIKGYLWQRYDETTSGLSRGFVLPDATRVSIEEAYRRLEGGVEVRGWSFEAELAQQFNHRHYPFDRKWVRVRLWHRDFDRNVVLTPDLSAYRRGGTGVTTLAGISDDLPVPGWRRRANYFTYRRHDYGTNFGLEGYVGQEAFPELYFTLGLERKATSAMITHLLPLLVATILLFAALVTVSGDAEHRKRLNFTYSGFQGVASGLFFVVVLSHIQLRRELMPEELTYAEHFYLCFYLVVLLSSIDAFLVSSGLGGRWLSWRDNLLPKLAYWPLLSGFAFLATWLCL